jgi:outer membrane protein
MKQFVVCVIAVAAAMPAMAQRGVSLFVDAEGVRRSSKTQFEPNVVQYEPKFNTGGGVGGGINWFFTDRVSLEMKAAALRSHLHIRQTGSDFVTVGDLGYAQIYPITALLQWHMLEGTAIRPYIGAGAGHVIVRNIEKRAIGLTGVRFQDPTGLVIDGGLELSLSKRWSLLGDARYTPIETHSRVTFGGTTSTARIDVKPLVVSTGIALRF